jgi:hypothetical protein
MPHSRAAFPPQALGPADLLHCKKPKTIEVPIVAQEPGIERQGGPPPFLLVCVPIRFSYTLAG